VIRSFVLLVAACSADDGGPKLASASPASAAHGASVIVTGEHLCLSRPCEQTGGTLQLGLAVPSVQAIVTDASDTRWAFVVPAAVPSGDTEIVITVNGRSSNALSFEVLP